MHGQVGSQFGDLGFFGILLAMPVLFFGLLAMFGAFGTVVSFFKMIGAFIFNTGEAEDAARDLGTAVVMLAVGAIGTTILVLIFGK